jgi:hypothetical protein
MRRKCARRDKVYNSLAKRLLLKEKNVEVELKVWNTYLADL